ncbi:MAG: hypothetical protein LBT73_02685 [Tannerellaceae bacterium]|jgi:hypothetical protein|nr:hypothetical protein [Tannerellaceae bacterium]
MRNYWGCRIYNRYIPFLAKELEAGRLRQGWGYDESQNLKNTTVDLGAKKNLRMLKVKKGDILLVPHLPVWEQVAIVEATEDWDTGYRFEIPELEDGGHDCGHIFPAKFIKSFTRNNKNVSKDIRSTLTNRCRFWCINHYADDVESLCSKNPGELLPSQSWIDRMEDATKRVFNNSFKQETFTDDLYKELSNHFGRAEWEHALVYGLKNLYPSYIIEKVGGSREELHGTDILIKIPGIVPDFYYVIAIQVKDYHDFVSKEVIGQIDKADKHWEEVENVKLIDKIVIIVKADKDDNRHLLNNESDVKFIFADELKTLLSEMGKSMIGINNDWLE